MRIVWLLCLLLVACEATETGMPPAKVGSSGDAHHDEALLHENKRIAEHEAMDIDAWIERHGLHMERTGTGVRYLLVQDSAGAKATAGQRASIRFSVSLINGRECYRSKGEPEEFLIEHDNVESGLHEAIQQLSVGDSAIIVIPSHRAYGLAGDQNKIPMRSTVIYHLRLLALR